MFLLASKMLAKVVLLLILAHSALSANILFINDIASPSHHIFNYALSKGLIERGHNLTMIGPDAHKNLANLKNYHPITLEGSYEEIHSKLSLEDSSSDTIFSQMKMFFDFCTISCKYHYTTSGFRQLRNYPKNFKFDLIIIDPTAGPCFHPFIQQFNYPPTVAITAFLLPQYLSEYFGNHLYASYIPFYHFGYTDDMSFSERVWNYFFTHLDMFLKYVHERPFFNKLAKQEWPESDDLDTLQRHISLLLANTNPILSFPQPITPNIIPIGGLHTRPAAKLPSDIQKIVDESKGIVIFSMGSNIRADQLDGEKFDAIIKALSKLPYTVLFKFESVPKKELPKNIVISKWLPVNDLLGNPKTKLFVTHGGALSTQEAMFHGVPMLGIPFLADQYLNCKMLTNRKLGLTQEFNSLTADGLWDKIKTILDNPEIYYKNAQHISKRFRDSPETPLERAVYWTEYAMRHNGTQFLSPKARDLGYLVKYHKDVEVFLLLIVLLVIYVISKLLRLFRQKKVKIE